MHSYFFSQSQFQYDSSLKGELFIQQQSQIQKILFQFDQNDLRSTNIIESSSYQKVESISVRAASQQYSKIYLQDENFNLCHNFELSKSQLLQKLKEKIHKKFQSPYQDTCKKLSFFPETDSSINLGGFEKQSIQTSSTLNLEKQTDNQLSRHLKISKKTISKLWARQILKFINRENTIEFNLSEIKISQIKKKLFRYSITIKQISQILKDNQWISIILTEKALINNQLLQQIFQSKNIKDQEKILLIQTYEIFKDAVKNPQEFKSWKLDLRKKKEQGQKFYEKYKNQPITQIISLINKQFEQEIQILQNKKCSKLNNISYCWVLYLKEIFEQGKFQSKIKNNLQLNQNLKQLLIKSPSISSIKNILKNRTFADYILQQKINTKIIIQEIITNQKLHILNKKNMLESLPNLQSMTRNCYSVIGWEKNGNL